MSAASAGAPRVRHDVGLTRSAPATCASNSRCPHGFAKDEIAVRTRLDARLPSGHDADSQRRPAFARDVDQIPATAIGQPDVGHQHIIRRAPASLRAAGSRFAHAVSTVSTVWPSDSSSACMNSRLSGWSSTSRIRRATRARAACAVTATGTSARRSRGEARAEPSFRRPASTRSRRGRDGASRCRTPRRGRGRCPACPSS